MLPKHIWLITQIRIFCLFEGKFAKRQAYLIAILSTQRVTSVLITKIVTVLLYSVQELS